MNYPGGKNGAGVWQYIINQIPPHEVYIEAFAGSAAVLRNKLPAKDNIAIEVNPGQAARLSEELPLSCVVWCADAMNALRDYPFTGKEFVYLDPPYLMSCRSQQELIYWNEFHTEEEHRSLLSLLLTIPAAVMISTYQSSLYEEMLQSRGWRSLTFTGFSRGGPKTEWIWMNYPEPTRLHDYRFLGDGFREREKIRRQQNRWMKKLKKMPDLKRYALLAALQQYSLAESGENSGRIAGFSVEDLPAFSDDGIRKASPELAYAARVALESEE